MCPKCKSPYWFEDKPIVLDDTCYFVPCGSQAEAVCVHDLTSSVFRNDAP